MAHLNLLDLLEHDDHDWHPAELRRLLRAPWFWPADPNVRGDMTARVSHGPPASRAPGHVLLMAWQPGETAAACLYELAPAAQTGGATLGQEAAAALDRARLVGARSAPFLSSNAALDDHVGWTARYLIRSQPKLSSSGLDGASFGLAMVLAAVSQSTGVPVPATVAATGTVGGDGSVGPVGGLFEKVSAVDRFALGVTTVLVPRGQGALARAAVTRPNLEVHEVGTADDALCVAFPRLGEALLTRWRLDQRAATHDAEVLYRLALDGHRTLLGWRGVAAAADALEDALPEGHVARDRARIAGLIARRHEGDDAVLSISDASLARERSRTRRTRLLAHVIQSAADQDDASALAQAERGWRAVPEWEHRVHEDFRVLGAIGRAYAHAGRYREACEALQQAVEGWLDEGEASQASHPVSAWVLALGIEGSGDELATLERTTWRAVFDDQATTFISRGFLAVALGRAWTQAGAAARGVAWLQHAGGPAAVDWNLVPSHLTSGRLRWLARALDQLGRHSEAAASRDELRHHHGSSPQHLLAQIDAGLIAGNSNEALAALESQATAHERLARELRRYAQRAKDDTVRSRLAALTTHFPY